MNPFDKVSTASIPEKHTAPFTPNFNKNGPAIFFISPDCLLSQHRIINDKTVSYQWAVSKKILNFMTTVIKAQKVGKVPEIQKSNK